MKIFYNSFICVFAALLLCMMACSRGGASYDGSLCRSLSTKIERHDKLSQRDYSLIIEQDEQILQYLIVKAAEIRATPEADRDKAWRSLTSDPEYMERFGYLFTLGSALYQADVNGLLDEDNERKYHELDRYNEQLTDYVTH